MSSPRGVKPQRAALLAIGDEVLRGEVSNTNAAFIAERLFEAGYDLAEQTVVSDDPQAIRTALVRLRAEMDVVIATGGLGPTEDDRTVDVVAELLVTGTSPDEPSLEAMKKRFSTHGFEMTPNNLRQVRIPNGTKALPNTAGIAPGFVVSLGTAEVFFLPGVPREMEKMFTDEVMPRLGRRLVELGGPRPVTRTWHLYGMGESHIDHRLAGILTGIDGATLHFRTSNPVNHVKLVVRRDDEGEAKAVMEKVEAELRKRIGPGIYGVDGETFPQAVAKALRAQEATMAIAESCTGGLAGELVTSESGASVFFRERRCLRRRGEDGRAGRQARDHRRLRRGQRADGARDGGGGKTGVRLVGGGGDHRRRRAGGGRAGQAGGDRLLRGLRAGHDARVDQAVRGRARARPDGRGLLRAGPGAALLRYA